MKTKKDRIIEAALKALAKNPLASMDQIAEEATIGRATLYRHFHSREVLIKQLFQVSVDRFTAIVLPILNLNIPARDKLDSVITQLIPFGAGFHFLMYEPWHSGDPEREQIFQKQLKGWRLLIQQLKKEAVIQEHASESWVALCLDSLIFSAWDAIHSGDIAPNEAPELVINMFLHGIGNKENNRS